MIPSRVSATLFPIAIALRLSVGCILAQEDPADLVQARTVYQRDVEFATRPIRDRYVAKLETLKRSLGSRGEAKAAAAVQDEIDRVREITTGQTAIAKFAGTWKVAYSVGTTRNYVITADGQVTLDDHDGKPPKTTKLIVKGNDVLLDLQDGWIERLRISGKTLAIDHFNPKGLYPAGQPNAKGTGTLAGAR